MSKCYQTFLFGSNTIGKECIMRQLELNKTIDELLINELKILVETKIAEANVLDKKYYSIDEVAFLTGLAASGITSRIKRKQIKATKPGRSYMIPLSEVRRLRDEIESVL